MALLAGTCAAQVMQAPGTAPDGTRRQASQHDKANLPSNPFENAPPPPSAPETQAPDAAPGHSGQPSQAAPSAPANAKQGTEKGAGAATPAGEARSASSTPPVTPAKPARVSFDKGQLLVNANDSSLSQILHSLATSSGMKIDGFSQDQRVFGQYGPGDPRDVLSSLLDGAGYNVLMLGETDDGAPRELILTPRSNAPIGNQPATASVQQDQDNDDDSVDNQPPMDVIPPPRMPTPREPQANPDGTPKTAQQILQELQRMREQQQQQQRPQE